MAAHQVVQTVTLPAEHERSGGGEIDPIMILVAALVQAVDPEAALLQRFQRAAEVPHAGHGEILESAGRGFGHGFGQPRRAALGHDHGGGSGGVGGAHDGAQVVRVLDAVQDNDEPRALQDVLQFAVLDGGSQSEDTLVRADARQPVQGLAGLEANRDAALARHPDQFVDPSSGGAAGDDEAVEGPARAQRFTHRVNSGQQAHVNRQDSSSGGSTLRRCGLQWLWMRPEAAPAPDPAEIPDKLYFRIGEVANLLGVEPYVLRYWEKEFPRLSPKKSGRDHRLYRRKDVELALEIKRLLYDSRYTIEGARKALAGRWKRAPRKAEPQPQAQGGLFEAPPASGVVEMVRGELEEILKLLR